MYHFIKIPSVLATQINPITPSHGFIKFSSQTIIFFRKQRKHALSSFCKTQFIGSFCVLSYILLSISLNFLTFSEISQYSLIFKFLNSTLSIKIFLVYFKHTATINIYIFHTFSINCHELGIATPCIK